jgi:hypothetical protein
MLPHVTFLPYCTLLLLMKKMVCAFQDVGTNAIGGPSTSRPYSLVDNVAGPCCF